MITKFNEYIVNEGFMIDKSIIKLAYNKALKHIKKAHESLTEDHIIELIIQFVLNNYGIDLSHSKYMYKHIKHYVHVRFLKKHLDESIRDEYADMFSPIKPEDEPQVVPGFESGTIDPNDDTPYDILGDEGKSDKERYEDFLKITRERNIQETEDEIIINIRRLWYDFYMTIYYPKDHYMKFLRQELLGKYISKGYRDLLNGKVYKGVINRIIFNFDGHNCYEEFQLNEYDWIKDGFCEDFITIDKLKTDVNKYNL